MEKKNLVIVESPAKAKTIKKFLGKEYMVEASLGHIKDLPENELGVEIKNNFKPTYEIIPEKKRVVRRLKKLSKEAKRIYLATDLDREGEAIAWHLFQILSHPEKNRITFNQITPRALKGALKKPGNIDMNKVKAQEARRVLDRLVGYLISPLLWDKVRRGLSAGRVQSVAVRLITEREEEIERFVPQKWWEIEVIFSTPRGERFKAFLSSPEGNKIKIEKEEEAKKTLKKIKEGEFIVKEVKSEERERKPHPPFTTSTLQQAASSLLKFSPSQTMRIAQELYEGQEVEGERVGLITYMRTDSVRVAQEAQREARGYLEKKGEKELLPPTPPVYRNKKISQDAHEAIRPTRIEFTPEKLKPYLSPQHLKLYELIWRRFISSQLKPAKFLSLSVLLEGGKHNFQSKGEVLTFPGFLTYFPEWKREDKPLPPLKEGEKVNLEESELKVRLSQPPPRYTEASLIKALENKGIGRPSTYAPIVSTIQERGYVRKKGGWLVPTPLGRVVTSLLAKHFSTLMDLDFTARLEEGLDEVEEGKKKGIELVEDFYSKFSQDLELAKRNMLNVKLEGVKIEGKSCPRCGEKMVLRFGRYGAYLSCTKKECGYTEKRMEKVGMKCPEEGCEGEIVEKRTKKGKIFYGCTNFPNCHFSSWYEPVPEVCPQCGNPYLLRKKGLFCPRCRMRKKGEESEKGL